MRINTRNSFVLLLLMFALLEPGTPYPTHSSDCQEGTCSDPMLVWNTELCDCIFLGSGPYDDNCYSIGCEPGHIPTWNSDEQVDWEFCHCYAVSCPSPKIEVRGKCVCATEQKCSHDYFWDEEFCRCEPVNKCN
ncbi:CLUMA_CG003406, isoform A [Clunio marinus]|uniref:CLUMA_CG003406, isoform A n=1 Tax=Clunio marinus TaxID=568069 RepID=A0A1J1HNP1_9DIPT|nr:CLUMA_CG003406, isoform A [Clunio marinus]